MKSNVDRAQWIHNPAHSLSSQQKQLIDELRAVFVEAHEKMINSTFHNRYRDRAEEALEMASMWAIKSITHDYFLQD